MDDLVSLFDKHLALARNRDKLAVRSAPNPGDGRQVEFYPPWEGRNPVPGKATVEVYNNQGAPGDVADKVVADFMHYFGAIDPRSKQPVDQTFWKLKQQFAQSLTPEQQAIDRRAYDRARAGEFGKPEQRSYDDWMQVHRLDQYLGAPMLPEGPDRQDWMGGMTPDQNGLLELMKQYMRRGSIAPGMNR
jgi:hypothetical protein